MKRIEPMGVYQRLPCSMVALGCAMGITDRNALNSLKSPQLKEDGYLSLKGMGDLIRANLKVEKAVYYARNERMRLRGFAHMDGKDKKAIICLLGHYVYFDGHDYYSYFWNGDDPVVKVWYIKEEEDA